MTLRRTLAVTTALALGWSALALFGALRGWWLEPLAPPGDADAFTDAAVACIEQAGRGSVALAMLEAGAIRTTFYRGGADEIDGHTLFPVASLNKWITAYGVMLLAQDGRIDLDAPVSTYLHRWQLPEPAPGLDNDQVTVRWLLSHTAGLTDGLGFADHDDDEPPPDLLAALEQRPARSSRDAEDS